MKGKQAHGLSLSPEALSTLRDLRKRNPKGQWVFQWNGKPVDDCNTLAFQKAVKRAKVGPLRWHDLRHTGASWAVQSGLPLTQVMELGGWKSYAMALRYSHLAPDQTAKAANAVGQMLHTGKKRKRA
jgi:integrase